MRLLSIAEAWQIINIIIHKTMEITLTDANFDQEVLKADKLVLVDFFATWCPPCQAMKPLIAKIAQEQSEKVKVGILNVDENPVIAGKYGVQSIPTFIFFKNGQEVKKFVGAVPMNILMEEINK